MLENLSKKIKKINITGISFFKNYLPHIVFLVFLYQLLAAAGNFPYVNLISKYYFYVFGFLWILSNFLFKKYVTNRRILLLAFLAFFLSIPTVLLGLAFLSDVLGFAAYVFLFTYVIKQVLIERTHLRQNDAKTRV